MTREQKNLKMRSWQSLYSITSWGTSIILLLTITVAAEPRRGSSNVCNRTVSKLIPVKVPVEVTYDRDVLSTCAGFLGCTRKEKSRKDAFKYEPRLVPETRLACCDGYTEDQNKDCVPVCSNACVHGDCYMPETCRCHSPPSENVPGWSGPLCNRFTCKSPDRWGADCNLPCNCSSNGFCEAEHGCVCFEGINCSEPCSETDCGLATNTIQRNSNFPIPAASSASIMAEQPEVETDTARAISTHVGIHFLLYAVMIAFCLVLSYFVISHTRRLKTVEDELYSVSYTTSSSSAAGSSGSFENPAYSLNNDSTPCSNVDSPISNILVKGTSLRSAERLPTSSQPAYEQFPDKEQTFSSAISNIFIKGAPLRSAPTSSQHFGKALPYIVNPKVEYNLITSKKDAKENLYCESNQSSSISDVASSPAHLPTATSNDYQVPRSPVRVNHLYRDDGDGESNIYEEIKQENIYSGDS